LLFTFGSDDYCTKYIDVKLGMGFETCAANFTDAFFTASACEDEQRVSE
jgi:hypothetical protein